MAKITRYQGDLQAFASDAAGQERVVFGTDVSSPVQSDDLTTNLDTEFFRGWATLPLGEKPPREWFNSVHWVSTQLSAYLHQMGVAEWDDEQEYNDNSIVIFGRSIFQSQTNANIGNNPSTDIANWKLLYTYISTTSDLIASSEVFPAGTIIKTEGFTTTGDGGGARWKATGNVITASQTPSQTGGATISDANGAEYKLIIDNEVTFEMFGAVGDGATDDYLPVVAAIGTAKSELCAIRILDKRYAVGTDVLIDFAIYMYADSVGTENTASNISLHKAGFKSIGATTVLKLSKSGTIIKNAVLKGFSIDGNFTATELIKAESCYNCTFEDIRLASTTGSDFAFELNDGNGGISLRNTINNVHYLSTANAAAIDSNGFKIGSTSVSGAGCVQNHVENISAFTQDGDCFYLNGCDNNTFIGIQSFVTGSGEGLIIAADGSGAAAARNNRFRELFCPVLAKTNTYGNEIYDSTSEAFTLVTESNSQIHFKEFDYIESSIYETHRYKASDYIGFGSGQFTVSGTATHISNALSIWQALQMPDSVTSGGSLTIPNFNKLKNGKLLKVELSFITDTVNSSADVHFRLRGEPISSGNPATVPNFDENITIPVPDAQNVTTVYEHTLSGSYGMPDTQNGYMIRLERLGGDAADTANGNVLFLAVRYYFEFDGPINGGSVQPTLPYKDF